MNKTSDTPFHRLTAWVTLLAFIFTSFPAHATLSQARGRIIFTQHKTAANRTSESATVTVTDAADATRVDTIASSYGFDAQGRMTQMTDASGHDTNGNQLRMRTTRTLASGVVTCKTAGRFQKCSFVPAAHQPLRSFPRPQRPTDVRWV